MIERILSHEIILIIEISGISTNAIKALYGKENIRAENCYHKEVSKMVKFAESISIFVKSRSHRRQNQVTNETHN